MSDDGISLLTMEHRKAIAAYLAEKAPMVGKCPTCGTRQWAILDHFVHLPMFYTDGSTRLGGPTYPNFGLICQNCGNTQIVNAIVSKILQGDKAEEKSAEGPSK